MRYVPTVRPRFLNLMLAALFVAAAACGASARQTQPTPVAVTINSAKANLITVNGQPKGWAVFVSFDTQFARSDSPQAENPANYRIINANTGTQVLVSEA